MSKYIGRQVDLGISRETTRGTYVAPTFYVPKVDFSFDDKALKARSQASLGTLEDSEEAFVIEKWGEGNMGGEVRLDSFPLFLYSLFGTVATTGPTDSSYSHAFSLENSVQHDSLSFTVEDPNTTERYSLVMLNSLELKQNVEGLLMYDASFMGRTAKGSSMTANYDDEVKFTKRHCTVKVAANLAALSAASSLSMKDVTLTFNQNVVRDSVITTAEPEDFLNRSFSIEGKFVLNYEDETWKEYMRNNTARAMEISWTNTDEVIGASTRPSMTFQFPNVDFFDWEPDNALDDIVTQTVSFKANRDVANDQAMVTTATVVNDTVSY